MPTVSTALLSTTCEWLVCLNLAELGVGHVDSLDCVGVTVVTATSVDACSPQMTMVLFCNGCG